MQYTAKDGKSYDFNPIDTRAMDFAYEVSRSPGRLWRALILVVDAHPGRGPPDPGQHLHGSGH